MFKAIKSFFSKVAALFTTPEGQKRVNDALTKAYDIMQVALPICETIASLTPTKTDDEIIALVKKYALPLALPDRPLTDGEKANTLRYAATSLVKQELVSVGVPANVIDLGVQLAYSALKANQAA
jgi:hypothetical protein